MNIFFNFKNVIMKCSLLYMIITLMRHLKYLVLESSFFLDKMFIILVMLTMNSKQQYVPFLEMAVS